MAAPPRGRKKAAAAEAQPPRRLNRVVGVAEALQNSLDPVFRKRGFASRDLITHWGAMAPAPYDRVAAPDRLAWPRGERSAEGAILYLRCLPGHALALQHEAPMIARSINRYFGYLLIAGVRMSAEPLAPKPEMEATPPVATAPDPQLDNLLAGVEDEQLRHALRRLGQGIKARTAR